MRRALVTAVAVLALAGCGYPNETWTGGAPEDDSFDRNDLYNDDDPYNW